MSKTKILLPTLIIVGFLFFNVNFSRAADITLNIDPSVIVKSGSNVTVTGTYSDTESPKTGREVCLIQQFKERRQNNFSPVKSSAARGCQEMVKGVGGSIIWVFTLTENKEGHYRYKLIRHIIGKDFDAFTLLKNSPTIEARNNVASVPLTNNDTEPDTSSDIDTTDDDTTPTDTTNDNTTNPNNDTSITLNPPNPVVGQQVVFTGTYSASDIPTGSNNAKVCWVINTQTQVSCVDAPSPIPNLEYTFPDALLYDVSLVARNKTDDSFIKVLDNLGVNVTQAADSADDSATSTSDGSGDMGGGASDGSGGGTVLNCFPNPLKFFRCDDDQATAMTVNDLVRNIINGIFGLLGAIAVGIIVYGGVLYMTAGASKDGTEKAKKIITSAAIGLIIALLSLAIVDLLFVLLGGR